jgi:hypothetical protein
MIRIRILIEGGYAEELIILNTSFKIGRRIRFSQGSQLSKLLRLIMN